MKYRCLLPLVVLPLLFCLTTHLFAETEGGAGDSESKWIINDGTALNLPGGSMTAIAIALDRGAEAIALELVLSKDDQIVLLSDAKIEEITNVADIYPDRVRADGSYYSFDFTLEELKRLSHRYGRGGRNSEHTLGVVVPQFSIISLSEMFGYIDLISTDLPTKPTLICELKKGWRHEREDKDLGSTVLTALENYQAAATANLFLASYDPEELQRLAENMVAENVNGIGFIQLIGDNDGAEVMRFEFGEYQPYNYDLLFTKFGLKAVSTYAAVIGLLPQTIIDASTTIFKPHYLDDAHILGVKVICYQADSAYLTGSAGAGTQEDLFEHLLFNIGFDGIVTRNDDLARQWLANRSMNLDAGEQKTIERLIEQIEDSGTEPSFPHQSDRTR